MSERENKPERDDQQQPQNTEARNAQAQKTEAEVIKALDDSLESLSNRAQHRLYQARQQAVQQAQQRSTKTPVGSRRNQWLSGWRPLIPLATAASFSAVFFYYQSSNTLPELDQDWQQDSELLFSADDLELYENLEFYAWLAEMENG